MKKEIKGIVVLLLMVAVMLIPLSVKAEMKVMTDNEMQVVTGEGVLFNFATSVLITVTKLPVIGTIVTDVTKVVTPIVTPLVTPLAPILNPFLNFLTKL